MTNKLTADDLKYIQLVEKKLHQVSLDMVLSTNNEFQWCEAQYNHTGINYKDKAISLFISELLNEEKEQQTQYRYFFYHSYFDSIVEIGETLISSNTSEALKLKMLDLFGDQEEELVKLLLHFAYYEKNSQLMLKVLQRGQYYSEVRSVENDPYLPSLIDYYEKIIQLGQVDIEDIEHNLALHLKNSYIIASDLTLIDLYLKIFSEKNLNTFKHALNIEQKELCEKIHYNTFSMIEINLSELVLCHLGYDEILKISNLVFEHNPHFPRFHVMGNNNDKYVQLIVESGNHHEEKVIALFKQLIDMKYDYYKDESYCRRAIADVMNKVSEKIDLEYELVPIESAQHNKKKQKI